MPTATNDGVAIRYERTGSGEPVVLVPTLGYGAWQWAWQFPALAGPFEAITYDLRGTGESDAPEGPYDVATLAADLEAVLADAGARRAHLVGLGLGGHVALEHAHRYGRARSLGLIGSTAGAPEADSPTNVVDRLQAPRDDPDALRSSLSPALSAGFREQHQDVIEGIVEWRSEEDAPRKGWVAQAPAFEAYEREWPPYEVTLPVLALQGGADEVVPPENAAIADRELPGADAHVFDGAGHLVTVERSRLVNDRLLGFLEEHAERTPGER